MKKVMVKGKYYYELNCGSLVPVAMLNEKSKISNAVDVLPFLAGIRFKEQECFKAVYLDGAHHVIGHKVITVGLLNCAPVHPREVFREAIAKNSNSIIIAHNHPSGSIEPSQADRDITGRLVQAGEIIGIKILDHIIVTAGNHYSFVENAESSLVSRGNNLF